MLKSSNLLLIFAAFFLLGCQYFKDEEEKRKKTPIARVGINYLYKNDLEASLPPSLVGADSVAVAESIIEEWLVQKLMEEKALDFLPQKKIETIERKVANYQSALYAFQYEQELLNQKMNTNITDEELQAYYEANPSAFVISTPVILARYFVLKKESAAYDSIKDWLVEKNDYEITDIEELLVEHASKYSIEGKWLDLVQLQKILPKNVSKESLLKKGELLEAKDDNHDYLVWLEDYQMRGNAPDGYQSDQLKRILINQKKEKYLDEIKNKLLNEGQDKKLMERY